MMEPAEKRTIATISSAIVLITVGVATGVYFVNRSPDTAEPRRFTIDWPDAGVPEGQIRCMLTTAVVQPSVLAIYGARSDAGSQYAYAHVCWPMPPDGGPSDEDELPALPEGMDAMEFEQLQEEYDGGPMFEAVLQGEPGWPCACKAGSDCQFSPWYAGGEWWEAPAGQTLSAGQWRGADCYPKSCVELAGLSSWPAACGEAP